MSNAAAETIQIRPLLSSRKSKAPKAPKAPLTEEERDTQTFIAMTKKRSARMATLTVLLLVYTGYKGVDWRIQLALVVLAFAAFNATYILAKRRRAAKH